jgi:hypothetical protein
MARCTCSADPLARAPRASDGPPGQGDGGHRASRPASAARADRCSALARSAVRRTAPAAALHAPRMPRAPRADLARSFRAASQRPLVLVGPRRRAIHPEAVRLRRTRSAPGDHRSPRPDGPFQCAQTVIEAIPGGVVRAIAAQPRVGQGSVTIGCAEVPSFSTRGAAASRFARPGPAAAARGRGRGRGPPSVRSNSAVARPDLAPRAGGERPGRPGAREGRNGMHRFIGFPPSDESCRERRHSPAARSRAPRRLDVDLAVPADSGRQTKSGGTLRQAACKAGASPPPCRDLLARRRAP